MEFLGGKATYDNSARCAEVLSMMHGRNQIVLNTRTEGSGGLMKMQDWFCCSGARCKSSIQYDGAVNTTDQSKKLAIGLYEQYHAYNILHYYYNIS